MPTRAEQSLRAELYAQCARFGKPRAPTGQTRGQSQGEAIRRFGPMRSRSVTTFSGRGSRRDLPTAFTEQRTITAAAAVLPSPRAVERSVFVVRAFVRYRYFARTRSDVARIAGTYHAWRGNSGAGKYEDLPGLCKSATLEETRKHGHVLTPGRYVGAEAAEDDGEPFAEKFARLRAQLEEQFAESARLDAEIRKNLAMLSGTIEEDRT